MCAAAGDAQSTGKLRGLEQFQQKCAAVLRPELRKNKAIERFRDSEKNGNALGELIRPGPVHGGA
ncbi:hypothetical protein EHI47_35360 [Rhizobium leguminosarum]|uniref:Uncharacterized protein n=1 Tax=Rhizobium leguminosarum TaxID=384 RepID=A0A444HJK5_RHILE|nr:hypothetical protein EHI45_24845 [Rhizobium leguminosarum]RWX21787.1 hypothetical protein EHI47_35360 [Rhizobium leguminosarum]